MKKMHSFELMDDGSLNEIYQSVAMRFAFGTIEEKGSKSNIKQLHPFVKCRDFLGDAMWATHFKKSYQIFGFKFDGTKEKVQLTKTVMLIEFNDEKKLEGIKRVLNHFEAAAKWKRSKLVKADKKTKSGKTVYVAIGSGCWMRSPTLISLYSLLWRLAGVGIKEEESVEDFLIRCEKVDSNDGRYLKSVKANGKTIGLKKHPFYVLTRRNKKVFVDTYKLGKNSQSGEVHNYHGVLGVTNRAVQVKNGQIKPTSFINDWAGNLVDIAKSGKENANAKKE